MDTALQSILQKALSEKWATGHFNASEFDHMRAIIEACAEVKAPAIIGTSEGERKHIGLVEIVAVRDAFRREFSIPIFLNADHTKSVSVAKEAVDAGYDSIHIDLSAAPFDENAAGTKEIVEYARATRLRQGYGGQEGGTISVEGELGYLRGESKVQKEKIEVKPEDFTDPEQAKKFVEMTGVNRLAIAVGNIHGITLNEPDLDIERISRIRAAVSPDVALVLHAGSGIPEGQISAAIDAGIANIHINTDIRVAFVDALKKSLSDHMDEVAMYKLDKDAIEAMKTVIKQKLTLFRSVGRI